MNAFVSTAVIAAAAPMMSLPTIAAASVLKQKVDAVVRARDDLREAKARWRYSEKWFSKWKLRDPRPSMREAWVGANQEYAVWWKAIEDGGDKNDPAIIALDPNRDLTAASREFSAAIKGWSERSIRVQKRLGLPGAIASRDAAADRLEAAVEELCETPARTLDELLLKAGAVRGNEGIAFSLVADINMMRAA